MADDLLGMNILGIPVWLILLSFMGFGVMLYLSKNRPARRDRVMSKPVKHEKKPDITTLVGKPESHKESEKNVKSVEDILAGDIDNAPSLGKEEKTEVHSSLGMLKLEGEDDEKEVPEKTKDEELQKIVKPETEEETEEKILKEKKIDKQEKPVETKPEKPVKKNLMNQKGNDYTLNLDEFAEKLEEPEDYTEPQTVTEPAKPPTPPPQTLQKQPLTQPPKEEKLNAVRQELKKGLLKKVLNEETPERVGEKGVSYFCMQCFDNGMSPMKTMRELEKFNIPKENARQHAYQTYKIWMEKRAPLITKLKEINDRIKRIHYKFLKRQIDEKTRKEMIIENQRELVTLEAQIKSTDRFFEENN